jgi:hypothetical protein
VNTPIRKALQFADAEPYRAAPLKFVHAHVNQPPLSKLFTR